jgi:hypothetical protein
VSRTAAKRKPAPLPFVAGPCGDAIRALSILGRIARRHLDACTTPDCQHVAHQAAKREEATR